MLLEQLRHNTILTLFYNWTNHLHNSSTASLKGILGIHRKSFSYLHQNGHHQFIIISRENLSIVGMNFSFNTWKVFILHSPPCYVHMCASVHLPAKLNFTFRYSMLTCFYFWLPPLSKQTSLPPLRAAAVWGHWQPAGDLTLQSSSSSWLNHVVLWFHASTCTLHLRDVRIQGPCCMIKSFNWPYMHSGALVIANLLFTLN